MPASRVGSCWVYQHEEQMLVIGRVFTLFQDKSPAWEALHRSPNLDLTSWPDELLYDVATNHGRPMLDRQYSLWQRWTRWLGSYFRWPLGLPAP